MTLILKSNVTASNSMPSTFKTTLPSDVNFGLDFVTQTYTKKGSSVEPYTLITMLRAGSSPLGYVNNSGDYTVANPSEMRIHNDKSVGRGVISEIPRKNELPNPDSPTSGTCSIPIRDGKITLIEVRGSGSARFVIDGITDVVVEEGNPFLYLGSSFINASAVVTINGSLSYFGAYSSEGEPTFASKHYGEPTHDKVYIKNEKQDSEFSVAFSRVLLPSVDNLAPSTQSDRNIIQFLGDVSGLVQITDSFYGIGDKKVKVKGGVTANFGKSIEDKPDEIENMVITFSATTKEMKVACDGKVHKFTVSNLLSSGEFIDRIVIGSPATTALGANFVGQMFKEFYHFDRLLTDDEMIAATLR